MSAPLPALYQLSVSPSGGWRARIFNLPAHRAGQVPTLPFLVALATNPVGEASEWHDDPERQPTVLRLAGTDRAGLEKLLRQLSAHGIARAAAFAPVRQSAQPLR